MLKQSYQLSLAPIVKNWPVGLETRLYDFGIFTLRRRYAHALVSLLPIRGFAIDIIILILIIYRTQELGAVHSMVPGQQMFGIWM